MIIACCVLSRTDGMRSEIPLHYKIHVLKISCVVHEHNQQLPEIKENTFSILASWNN